MKLYIYLPKETGFDIEFDGEYFYSKYESIDKTMYLSKGVHTLSIDDQSPVLTSWNHIVGFFDPLHRWRKRVREITENIFSE